MLKTIFSRKKAKLDSQQVDNPLESGFHNLDDQQGIDSLAVYVKGISDRDNAYKKAPLYLLNQGRKLEKIELHSGSTPPLAMAANTIILQKSANRITAYWLDSTTNLIQSKHFKEHELSFADKLNFPANESANIISAENTPLAKDIAIAFGYPLQTINKVIFLSNFDQVGMAKVCFMVKGKLVRDEEGNIKVSKIGFSEKHIAALKTPNTKELIKHACQRAGITPFKDTTAIVEHFGTGMLVESTSVDSNAIVVTPNIEKFTPVALSAESKTAIEDQTSTKITHEAVAMRIAETAGYLQPTPTQRFLVDVNNILEEIKVLKAQIGSWPTTRGHSPLEQAQAAAEFFIAKKALFMTPEGYKLIEKLHAAEKRLKVLLENRTNQNLDIINAEGSTIKLGAALSKVLTIKNSAKSLLGHVEADVNGTEALLKLLSADKPAQSIIKQQLQQLEAINENFANINKEVKKQVAITQLQALLKAKDLAAVKPFISVLEQYKAAANVEIQQIQLRMDVIRNYARAAFEPQKQDMQNPALFQNYMNHVNYFKYLNQLESFLEQTTATPAEIQQQYDFAKNALEIFNPQNDKEKRGKKLQLRYLAYLKRLFQLKGRLVASKDFIKEHNDIETILAYYKKLQARQEEGFKALSLEDGAAINRNNSLSSLSFSDATLSRSDSIDNLDLSDDDDSDSLSRSNSSSDLSGSSTDEKRTRQESIDSVASFSDPEMPSSAMTPSTADDKASQRRNALITDALSLNNDEEDDLEPLPEMSLFSFNRDRANAITPEFVIDHTLSEPTTRERSHVLNNLSEPEEETAIIALRNKIDQYVTAPTQILQLTATQIYINLQDIAAIKVQLKNDNVLLNKLSSNPQAVLSKLDKCQQHYVNHWLEAETLTHNISEKFKLFAERIEKLEAIKDQNNPEDVLSQQQSLASEALELITAYSHAIKMLNGHISLDSPLMVEARELNVLQKRLISLAKIAQQRLDEEITQLLAPNPLLDLADYQRELARLAQLESFYNRSSNTTMVGRLQEGQRAKAVGARALSKNDLQKVATDIDQINIEFTDIKNNLAQPESYMTHNIFARCKNLFEELQSIGSFLKKQTTFVVNYSAFIQDADDLSLQTNTLQAQVDSQKAEISNVMEQGLKQTFERLLTTAAISSDVAHSDRIRELARRLTKDFTLEQRPVDSQLLVEFAMALQKTLLKLKNELEKQRAYRKELAVLRATLQADPRLAAKYAAESRHCDEILNQGLSNSDLAEIDKLANEQQLWLAEIPFTELRFKVLKFAREELPNIQAYSVKFKTGSASLIREIPKIQSRLESLIRLNAEVELLLIKTPDDTDLLKLRENLSEQIELRQNFLENPKKQPNTEMKMPSSLSYRQNTRPTDIPQPPPLSSFMASQATSTQSYRSLIQLLRPR